MAVSDLTQTERFVNSLLLGIMVTLGISGLIILYGDWLPWIYDLHRISGFSLIVLIPFKATMAYRSLQRSVEKSFARSMAILNSFLLSVLVLLSSALGLMWMWRVGPYSGLSQTLMAWHWILGLVSLPPFALHIWRRWLNPHRDYILSRRSALNMLGLVGASIVLGKLATLLAETQSTGDSPRRFTGSRGFGLRTGNDFPTTGESPAEIDPSQWRLRVVGAVQSPVSLSYKEILLLPQQVITEAIDCHNGWYSVQDWQGVPLVSLLEKAGRKENMTGVRLVSATGLSNTYPAGELDKILLATHVTGRVLEPSHGFPLRAVISGRRGWFWLKWLTRIEVLVSPIEVVGGILCTPLQVLRDLKYPRSSNDIR
jgi:hypothetical protein